MIGSIVSVLGGLVLGFIYGAMFCSPFFRKSGNNRSELNCVFNSFFRLVFITVAIMVSLFYIDLNFVWLLLGFLIAFWGAVLNNIRATR